MGALLFSRVVGYKKSRRLFESVLKVCALTTRGARAHRSAPKTLSLRKLEKYLLNNTPGSPNMVCLSAPPVVCNDKVVPWSCCVVNRYAM